MDQKPEKLLKFPPSTPEQRIIWEIIFLFVIIITVGIFGRLASINILYTWIISIIFAINLCIRFWLINEKGDWLFFLFGIIAGGGNDLISMINGIYNYTSVTIIPFLNGLLPLWMILFWGQIFLLFRKVFHLKWFKGDEFKKDGPFLKGWINWQLIIDLIVLICLRIVIYNTYLDPLLPIVIISFFVKRDCRLLFSLPLYRAKKRENLIVPEPSSGLFVEHACVFRGNKVKFLVGHGNVHEPLIRVFSERHPEEPFNLLLLLLCFSLLLILLKLFLSCLLEAFRQMLHPLISLAVLSRRDIPFAVSFLPLGPFSIRPASSSAWNAFLTVEPPAGTCFPGFTPRFFFPP